MGFFKIFYLSAMKKMTKIDKFKVYGLFLFSLLLFLEKSSMTLHFFNLNSHTKKWSTIRGENKLCHLESKCILLFKRLN